MVKRASKKINLNKVIIFIIIVFIVLASYIMFSLSKSNKIKENGGELKSLPPETAESSLCANTGEVCYTVSPPSINRPCCDSSSDSCQIVSNPSSSNWVCKKTECVGEGAQCGDYIADCCEDLVCTYSGASSVGTCKKPTPPCTCATNPPPGFPDNTKCCYSPSSTQPWGCCKESQTCGVSNGAPVCNPGPPTCLVGQFICYGVTGTTPICCTNGWTCNSNGLPTCTNPCTNSGQNVACPTTSGTICCLNNQHCIYNINTGIMGCADNIPPPNPSDSCPANSFFCAGATCCQTGSICFPSVPTCCPQGTTYNPVTGNCASIYTPICSNGGTCAQGQSCCGLGCCSSGTICNAAQTGCIGNFPLEPQTA